MPVKLVSANGTGGHGDIGGHAAAHVRAQGNQAAGTLPNIIIKTTRTHFPILVDMEMANMALWSKLARSRVILESKCSFLGGFVFWATKQRSGRWGGRRLRGRWYGG